MVTSLFGLFDLLCLGLVVVTLITSNCTTPLQSVSLIDIIGTLIAMIAGVAATDTPRFVPAHALFIGGAERYSWRGPVVFSARQFDENGHIPDTKKNGLDAGHVSPRAAVASFLIMAPHSPYPTRT